MPEKNPFLSQIQSLANEIDDLIEEMIEASAASQASKVEQLAKDIQAKSAVRDDLLVQSFDWQEGRVDAALNKLQALVNSELAKQANVVARLKKVAKSLGATVGGDKVDNASEPEALGVRPAVLALASGPGGEFGEIDITDTDADALARVAMSEVGHFGKHGQDQLTGGVKAVVETILNRVAHASFPNTIITVADQPAQFSAINSVGSWTNLPIPSDVVSGIVISYLTDRLTGVSGMLRGATHFLNPHLSSATALDRWGNHVVQNAVVSFGNNDKKDVHFHGFAPGTPLPRSYTLKRGEASASFEGDGTSRSLKTLPPDTMMKIIQICLAEHVFFENGSKREADSPQFKRVGEYWKILGLPYDGKTQILNKKTKKTYNPPWSSAFISFVMSRAGLTGHFVFSQAHCHYVQAVVSGTPNSALSAKDPEEYILQAGDIVHYGREWAKGFDFAEAKSAYMTDSFYPSHSDIVVEIDSAAKKARTVGGNVSNTVGTKVLDLNANGTLRPRRENGQTYPWIAVLSINAS